MAKYAVQHDYYKTAAAVSEDATKQDTSKENITDMWCWSLGPMPNYLFMDAEFCRKLLVLKTETAEKSMALAHEHITCMYERTKLEAIQIEENLFGTAEEILSSAELVELKDDIDGSLKGLLGKTGLKEHAIHQKMVIVQEAAKPTKDQRLDPFTFRLSKWALNEGERVHGASGFDMDSKPGTSYSDDTNRDFHRSDNRADNRTNNRGRGRGRPHDQDDKENGYNSSSNNSRRGYQRRKNFLRGGQRPGNSLPSAATRSPQKDNRKRPASPQDNTRNKKI